MVGELDRASGMSEGLGRSRSRHQLQGAAEAVHRGPRGEVAEPRSPSRKASIAAADVRLIAVQRGGTDRRRARQASESARSGPRLFPTTVATCSTASCSAVHRRSPPGPARGGTSARTSVERSPPRSNELPSTSASAARPVAASVWTRAVVTSIDGSVESEDATSASRSDVPGRPAVDGVRYPHSQSIASWSPGCAPRARCSATSSGGAPSAKPERAGRVEVHRRERARRDQVSSTAVRASSAPEARSRASSILGHQDPRGLCAVEHRHEVERGLALVNAASRSTVMRSTPAPWPPARPGTRPRRVRRRAG